MKFFNAKALACLAFCISTTAVAGPCNDLEAGVIKERKRSTSSTSSFSMATSTSECDDRPRRKPSQPGGGRTENMVSNPQPNTSANTFINTPGGAINTTTGEFYPRAGSGIINPNNGAYYPRTGGGNGYINSDTGEYIPAR